MPWIYLKLNCINLIFNYFDFVTVSVDYENIIYLEFVCLYKSAAQ